MMVTLQSSQRALFVTAIAMALVLALPMIAGAQPSDDAKDVAASSDRFTVELTMPTSGNPVTAAPGQTFAASFQSNRSWPYRFDARETNSGDDWELLDGEDAQGTATRGDNTVELTVPEGFEDGDYDVRLRLFTPGRPVERASDVASGGLHVGMLPTTGFEDRDGDGWTTHDEELAFLDEVSAQSERMTYTEIGTSHEDRPLHLVQLGDPAPPADDAIADGIGVLVIGSQHGTEQAGREMGLQLLRDLAFTGDPELIDQLGETTILVVPTANPDGVAAGQRQNAVGVDLNRDHFDLSQPETRAIAQVLRDFRPGISIDAHEASSAPDNPDSSYMKIAWQRNLNVHEDIYDLNVEMVDDYLFPGLEAAGYTEYGHYGSPGDGEDGPWFLSQNFGLRHGLGMLTESWIGGEPTVRVDIQMVTALEILRFQRERGHEIAEATTRAPDEKAHEGEEQSAPFYLRGADWDTEPPPDEYVLDPPPCGYLVHADHAEQIEQQVELFPLVTEDVGEEGLFVPMGQPLMTMVPDLLDERGREHVVAGIPLDDCSDPGAVEPPPPPPPPTEPAQYGFDFADDVVDEAPAGWTSMWNDSEYTVRDNPRRLEHAVQDRSDGDGRQALTVDEPGDGGVVRGDVELSALVRGVNNDTLFQLGVHLSGENPADANAYYTDARLHTASSANNARVGRHLDGSFSILGRNELPFTVDEDTWYRVVLQREGNHLRTKMWPDGEEEPQDWVSTVWDTSFDEGRVGIMHFTGDTVVDWAFVGVGVGGEEAPRPPEDLPDE